MNGNKFFGGVEFVPGVGYVQGGASSQAAALGDDSSVMMISGLSAAETGVSYSGSTTKPLPGFSDLTAELKKSYRIFGIALPLWAWLLLATGAIGAGVFFWKKGKF